MIVIRLAALVLLLFGSSGCSSSDPRNVTSPTAPTAPPLRVPPQPSPVPAGPRLSGLVFESLGGGRRPLPESRVYYTLADGTIDVVLADNDGRYVVAPVPEGGRVRVTAFSDPNRSGMLFQMSGASVTIQGDTTLDVELVSGDTREPIDAWPTLSGMVYRETGVGRQPVARTRVYYGRQGLRLYDVYLETDAQGRFRFERLPLGPGRLGAGNCNDQAQTISLVITADTVRDVDLTNLFATCPGVPY